MIISQRIHSLFIIWIAIACVCARFFAHIIHAKKNMCAHAA